MKNLFASLALISSLSAFATSNEGNLTISGVVEENLSLTLSQDTYTDLDIVNGGARLVSTATESANTLGGYSVYAYSLNGSILKNQTDTDIGTSYKVQYGGSIGKTLGKTEATRTELKKSGPINSAVRYNNGVIIDVTPYSKAPAGTYQDTITFQIEAN